VVSADEPLLLFDAGRDWGDLLLPHQWGYVRYNAQLVSGAEPGSAAVRAHIESLDAGPRHYALQAEVLDRMSSRDGQLAGFDALVARIRSAEAVTERVGIGLITSDGSAWTTSVRVTSEWTEVVVPIDDLARSPRALLPRPYPVFLPYWFTGASSDGLTLEDVQVVEFSVDRGALESPGPHGFEVESLVLTRLSDLPLQQ
jgi:hypothetical protein